MLEQVAYTYISKMTALEEAYMRGVEAKRKQARLELLDILDRDGISQSGVQQMQSIIQNLRRDIVELGRDASRAIRKTVYNYTSKQIDMAKRAGLDTGTDARMIELSNMQAQQDGEAAFMTSSPLWLNTLESGLAIEAARLRLSGTDNKIVADRLLSNGIGDGRNSLWQASGVSAGLEEQKDVWTYAAELIAIYLATLNTASAATYQKQVIATIDKRTTQCCLMAHGQIQPLDKPFVLRGTPRFADKVQDPPFHWYCRSTEVLYNPAFEEFGVTTQQMRDAANAEISARIETGQRVDIYPSHATARRK